MQSDNLAPIVLFVYNRLWHTQKTIRALQKNELALESELFIYADGAKNEKTSDQVSQVRSYIQEVSGFKKITIIERDKNWGLANSIIDGVTKIVNEFGRVIVLEDDLVTSQFFLRYMNDALEFYKDEEEVMHISGWNYPIEFTTNNDVFLYRTMDCWGWATWADSWKYFEKDTNKLISKFSKKDIQRFNLDGCNNVWTQVILNKYNQINTWAIYWYASIFNRQGLCLNPVKSFVKNIGHDGSGVHCNDDSYMDNVVLNVNDRIKFINNISEDYEIVSQVKIYFKKQHRHIVIRLSNKLSRLIIGKNLIK